MATNPNAYNITIDGITFDGGGANFSNVDPVSPESMPGGQVHVFFPGAAGSLMFSIRCRNTVPFATVGAHGLGQLRTHAVRK